VDSTDALYEPSASLRRRLGLPRLEFNPGLEPDRRWFAPPGAGITGIRRPSPGALPRAVRIRSLRPRPEPGRTWPGDRLRPAGRTAPGTQPGAHTHLPDHGPAGHACMTNTAGSRTHGHRHWGGGRPGSVHRTRPALRAMLVSKEVGRGVAGYPARGRSGSFTAETPCTRMHAGHPAACVYGRAPALLPAQQVHDPKRSRSCCRSHPCLGPCMPPRSARLWVFVVISVPRDLGPARTFPLLLHESAGERAYRCPGNVERSSRLGLTWADGVWLGRRPQVKRARPTFSGGCGSGCGWPAG
jgi:hypothetical protein